MYMYLQKLITSHHLSNASHFRNFLPKFLNNFLNGLSASPRLPSIYAHKAGRMILHFKM